MNAALAPAGCVAAAVEYARHTPVLASGQTDAIFHVHGSSLTGHATGTWTCQTNTGFVTQYGSVIVASHNIMHGLRLARLVLEYRALREEVGLDVLCIQENIPLARGSYASRIADELGPGYVALWDPTQASMGMVVHTGNWTIEKDELVELPRSESVSWIDRSYLQGGTISKRHAQVVKLTPRTGGPTVAVVNFHLQTAGTGDAGTQMRRQQIEAIARLVERAGHARSVVACGDTNAFSWPWKKQGRTLQYILEPLTGLGAVDPGEGSPTHFFGRQNEPKLTHRVGVILGRAGLDLPMRYDVICTSLPVVDRGHTTTPDSDHDLIWARLAPSASP